MYKEKHPYIPPAAEPLAFRGAELVCTSDDLTLEDYKDKDIVW